LSRVRKPNSRKITSASRREAARIASLEQVPTWHVYGVPRIKQLNPTATSPVPVRYYVFDVLRLDGVGLLKTRTGNTAGYFAASTCWPAVPVPSSFTEAHGSAVLHSAELAGFEGVVAKGSPRPTGRQALGRLHEGTFCRRDASWAAQGRQLRAHPQRTVERNTVLDDVVTKHRCGAFPVPSGSADDRALPNA
jgi:hypothetical protein